MLKNSLILCLFFAISLNNPSVIAGSARQDYKKQRFNKKLAKIEECRKYKYNFIVKDIPNVQMPELARFYPANVTANYPTDYVLIPLEFYYKFLNEQKESTRFYRNQIKNYLKR